MLHYLRPFKLEWWQAALYETGVLALGIIIGSTWPEPFLGWHPILWLVFILFGGYIISVWLKQQ